MARYVASVPWVADGYATLADKLHAVTEGLAITFDEVGVDIINSQAVPRVEFTGSLNDLVLLVTNLSTDAVDVLAALHKLLSLNSFDGTENDWKWG